MIFFKSVALALLVASNVEAKYTRRLAIEKITGYEPTNDVFDQVSIVIQYADICYSILFVSEPNLFYL